MASSLYSHKPQPRPSHITSLSHASRRYRDDIHLIPTPGLEARRPEPFGKWPLTWLALGLAALMIIIGIGVEITLALSNSSHGFAVPQHNIFAFLPFNVSFLTSFFPTMFIIPLSICWGYADYVLRWYQPYIILSRGNARAEESIMMDYIMSNRIVTIWRVFRRRQWIIYFSMITALVTDLYQPLAGALLAVKTVSVTQAVTAEGTTTLGLIPDVESLNAFIAAAGFTEAAAFQGLPDPPFVKEGWASAQFRVDMAGMETCVAAQTTGIRTTANCASPSLAPVIDTSNSTNFVISTSLPDGCSSSVTFDPNSAQQQYGSAAVDHVSCGLPADFPEQFAPVMFWFYHMTAQNQPQASAVICRPTVELFNIVADVDVASNNLTSVTIASTYTTANSPSSAPSNGSVFNAVLFGDLPGNDKFVQARATAVGSQIPGAILRLASQDAETLQQYFDSPDGFQNLTTQIYTQHLSVTAKTVYFVPARQSLPAERSLQQERLVVDKFAGHALGSTLIVVGLIGIVIHLAHRQLRRNVRLYAHPGTIASIVALTSHSGFGELLYPFDDKQTISKKLSRYRFSLDSRTGAIVADEVGEEEYEGEHTSDVYRDYDASGKTSLTVVESHTPLLSGEEDSKIVIERSSSTSPAHLVDLPYEVEPLVLPHSLPGMRTSGIS